MNHTPCTLIPDISNDEYHSSHGISSTQLKLALKAPALYRASIDGKLDDKKTKALGIGAALHPMLLQPEKLSEEVITMPEFSRKAADKEAKEEFRLEHSEKAIVSQADMDTARAMAASVLSDPEARSLLEVAQSEMSGWYTDPDTGLLCRYRPDARTDWIMIDIKSCRDASKDGFTRAIQRYGYHISAAHYLAGDSIVMGTSHRQFCFICVESEPPHLTAIYVLEEEDLQYGDWERRKALYTIKNCTETGLWPSYNGGVPTPISLPYWAKKKFLEEQI